MKKQILSTCLAISLIASNTYVSAASTDTTELTDDQSKAVLGGLLVIGLATTLYGQTVTRAEEAEKQQAAATEAAAKQKATKTLSAKPGHTYVWSSGSADTAPTVTYIESCTPAKQYSATAKLANGVADTNDSRITVKNDSCTIAYDSRHKAVQEYAGNPWSLSASSYKNQQARIAEAEERSAEATVAIIGGLGKWLFGGGSSSGNSTNSSNYTASQPNTNSASLKKTGVLKIEKVGSTTTVYCNDGSKDIVTHLSNGSCTLPMMFGGDPCEKLIDQRIRECK